MSFLKAARFVLNAPTANMIAREHKKLFSVACARLSDLKFTEKHEWIKVNGNVGTVGITDYAQVSTASIYPELYSIFNF